jgi:hypothetical protein
MIIFVPVNVQIHSIRQVTHACHIPGTDAPANKRITHQDYKIISCHLKV